MRLRSLALALSFISSSLVFAAPAITRNGEQLTIDGVTSGGSVLVVSFVNVPGSRRWKSRIDTSTVIDTDSDGVVSSTVASDGQSLTIAIDLASGASGTLQPQGRIVPVPNSEPFPPLSQTLHVGATAIDAQGDSLDFLVVRAGVGVWWWHRGDLSPTVPAISTELASARALTAGTPSTTELAPADTVIAVRCDTLDRAMVQVGAAQ